MKCEKLSPTDADALLRFFCQLVDQDSERVERPEDALQLDHDKEVAWINGLLEKERAGEVAALCVLNDEAVIVGLGEVERRPRWIERHVAEIRFGLLPGCLDEGCELVRQLEQRATFMGIELLYYFHLATQSQGIAVLEACGFELSGELPGYYKKEQGYVDRVFYSKTLGVSHCC
ncbi:N-acetyltransferase [Pseudomonas nabeulensis]|uniref:N-acetyltransferase n=1 Tax=Pseudomonas nabeulensis TaxID=2293833 RepID=A0A4Z0AG40_9PSED|nr:GNAT family N-acetyltransferase [Pseudomonas nabeulensis]TFY85347.1 N-acetyltransferase [Pseudomonas nabeulensis]